MKFYPPHYLLVLSLCMLGTWYFGKSSSQTLPLILVGLGLIGLGFLLAFNSIARFIKAKTGVVPFSESTTLITEGFYKYTRNPMYVGMNSFLLGLLIILNNPINLIFLIIFFFLGAFAGIYNLWRQLSGNGLKIGYFDKGKKN